MNYFVGIDWGTTSLRIRLVDYSSKKPIVSIELEMGAAVISAKLSDPLKRKQKFRSVLEKEIPKLLKKEELEVDRMPILISGMASSSIGWEDSLTLPLLFLFLAKTLITSNCLTLRF